MIQILLLFCLCLLITLGSQWLRNGARSRLARTSLDQVIEEESILPGLPAVPPAPQARAVAPAEDAADCLCNQCEQAPACAMRYPECVGGHPDPFA